jgi:hypothetical protein
VPNCLSVLIDGAKEPHNNPFSAPLERKITGSKINDNLLAFSYDCRVSEAQKQKNAARLEEAKAFRAVDPKTNGWTGKG